VGEERRGEKEEKKCMKWGEGKGRGKGGEGKKRVSKVGKHFWTVYSANVN